MICHLIDANIDTPFFRSIAKMCDRTRYPVMIGSIAPSGSLQAKMQTLHTPTFALGATARWHYPRALWRLVHLLKRERIQVLHAHCFDPTWLGLLAARIVGIPFVFTRHHSDHHIRLGKRWHTKMDSWCARMADQVIAVSEATKQIMMEVENVPSPQTVVVYNGMEPMRLPASKTIAQTRKSLGNIEGHILLMIARLHEEKGHRFLFTALPEIIKRVGKVTLLLAGDGHHRSEIEAQAQAAGISDSVCFLGWRDDVAELISIASMVVLPSLAESFGFALLEAMSLGKPVVAATTGGIPEVVADGVTGRLVPQREPKPLADAIIALLTNQPLANEYGQAGRERATTFTFARMICGYETVYDNVLSKTRPRHPLPTPSFASEAGINHETQDTRMKVRMPVETDIEVHL